MIFFVADSKVESLLHIFQKEKLLACERDEYTEKMSGYKDEGVWNRYTTIPKYG